MNPQQHQSEGASSEVSARLKPPRDLLISYAQNFEDVLLHRVFANVDHGFYVDIGAFDPVIGSVTKIFYDRGWNGINIEPGSAFDRLAAARPRDINLKVAILDERGTVTFVENTADPGASHIDSSVGAEHGGKTQSYSVPCDRLDHVLAEHADGRIINFMKIDAEGHLFVTGASGVWVFEPDGTCLGVIVTPGTHVTLPSSRSFARSRVATCSVIASRTRAKS